jgi:RimJ/RimL family protein N-acetyltransferase
MPPIPLPDPALADAAVRLRAARLEDVPTILRACQDPQIQRFTFVPTDYDEDLACAWVTGAAAERERGEGLELIIASAETDELLGAVGLLRFAWPHRAAELGYWVAPWARGAGVAVRASRLLAPWALRTLGLARISCEVDVENGASRRVAERAGFTREGVLRSAIEAKGRRWTLVVHSLLPEDLA